MKIQLKLFVLIAAMAAVMVACKSKNSKGDEANLVPGTHKIEVKEVLQTSNYTYLRATENEKEIWLAIAKQEDVEVGGTYYYAQPLEMNKFPSKELNRTFESILFVQTFSKQPIAMVNNKPAVSPGSQKASPGKKEVKVEPAEGGITIAQLFEKRNSYSGKKVKIRGQVIKFNTEIMGKNWAHIQDGTSNGDNFDLTVTTRDVVTVGDVVLFEGTITLDKDFGAGYSYSVIMEDARMLKK